MAAIVGLEAALNRPCQVELYSDLSLTDAFNQHWIDSWWQRDGTAGKAGR